MLARSLAAGSSLWVLLVGHAAAAELVGIASSFVGPCAIAADGSTWVYSSSTWAPDRNVLADASSLGDNCVPEGNIVAALTLTSFTAVAVTSGGMLIRRTGAGYWSCMHEATDAFVLSGMPHSEVVAAAVAGSEAILVLTVNGDVARIGPQHMTGEYLGNIFGGPTPLKPATLGQLKARWR